MIFITLGSQKFQFNRLLKIVDNLVAKGVITEPIFAQSGASKYVPRFFEYKDYISREVFKDKINNCDLVITHGGTGAILTALKKDKKVIVVPRLSKFGEHVDDHQTQIATIFQESNLVLTSNNEQDLINAYSEIRTHTFNKFVSNNDKFIQFFNKNI